MADVFISYAREDRALASELAEFLKSNGIDFWWDEQILGSDDFYEVILAALSRAKAAIVIWTKSSVKSRFVRDEARFALHNDKLIATKAPDLDVIQIPFGFQSQHTDDIVDRDRILKALAKLGAKAAPPKPVEQRSRALDDWEAVKHTTKAEDILDYLAKHPASPHRAECLAKLRELTTGPAAARAAPPAISPAAPSSVSRVKAFLSGFSFRLPEFQSLASGTYAAIGGAVFYVILAVGMPVIVMNAMSARPYGYWTLGSLSLLVTLLGLQRYWAWRKQRNFTAAVVTALAASGIAGLMVSCFAAAGTDVGGGDEQVLWLWPTTSVAMMALLSFLLYRAR